MPMRGVDLKRCYTVGMSQYEIARQLGVKHQSVSNWYTGKSLPSLENLVALAGLLNVDCKTLIEDFLKRKKLYNAKHPAAK